MKALSLAWALFFVVSIMSGTASAEPAGGASTAWSADLGAARARFEQFTGMPIRQGFRVEATLFPHYYALRSDRPDRGGIYFRDDMTWTANIRSPGWSAADGSHASERGRSRWYRDIVLSMPLDRLVAVKRRTPFVAVIWSAPDCPVCRALEASLEEEGASVYVVPVGLSEAGYRSAARIYCAKDPRAAWLAEMGEQVGASGSMETRSGCTYPRAEMADVGYFLGRGRPATPIMVFADGTGISGWDQRQGPARLREMIAAGRFFTGP